MQGEVTISNRIINYDIIRGFFHIKSSWLKEMNDIMYVNMSDKNVKYVFEDYIMGEEMNGFIYGPEDKTVNHVLVIWDD